MPSPSPVRVARLWLTATRGYHVPVRELPRFLVKILADKGRYKRRDIEVIPSPTVDLGIPAFEGNRNYAILVNLGTQQHKTLLGEYSGGMGQSAIDRPGSYNIPSNGAVVVGEYGGRGSFARIYIHPDNVAALIEDSGGVELPEDEKYALTYIAMFNSRGRRDAFSDKGLGSYGPSNPLILSLAQKGLVKVTGRGVRITTQGKNVRQQLPRKYESTW